MTRIFALALLAALLAAPVACRNGSRENSGKPEETIVAEEGEVPGGTHRGRVVETMSTAGYTYVLFDTGKEQVWAAAPEFAVTVGDEVIVPPGAPMADHYSRTLDRKFDLVYFVSSVTVVGEEGASGGNATDLPPGHPRIDVGNAVSHTVPARSDINLAGIARAEGGKTVAEIYAAKSELSGKEVVVRGRVVKFTPAIMGTNWVHLQDGTGEEGANDLTITTSATVKVGDTVVARGALGVDRDFGYGYHYAVIIENGEITTE